MSHMSELMGNLRRILGPMTSSLACSDWQPPRSLLLTAQALRTWTWLLQALRKRHFQENEKFYSLKVGFQGKLGLLRRRIREKEKTQESPRMEGKVWRHRYAVFANLTLASGGGECWADASHTGLWAWMKMPTALRSLRFHGKFIKQKNKTDF